MLIKFNNSLLFKEKTRLKDDLLSSSFYLTSNSLSIIKFVIYNKLIQFYTDIYINRFKRKSPNTITISLEYKVISPYESQNYYKMSIGNVCLDALKFKSFFYLLHNNMQRKYNHSNAN